MSLRFLILPLLILVSVASAKEADCVVCGMKVKEGARVGFEAVHENKAIHFCSFACASAFHKKHPDSALRAFNYLGGEPVDAAKAFYLVKSKGLLKEVEFGMPPVVAAFSSKADAEGAAKRLGDGKVVQGLESVK